VSERPILVVAATGRELPHAPGAETINCGIGPVEAALATASALARERPRAILHVGIAGAASLEPGALVIGSEAVYCDLVDPASTLPRVLRAAPAPALVDVARRALPEAHVLPIATSARVGGGGGFEVEAMEGFAVLRAAEAVGVPAVEVRAISNAVAHLDRSLWRIDDALAALANAAERILRLLL